MTSSNEACMISYAISVSMTLPIFLHVCSITMPALQSGGILTPAALDSVFFVAMIGVGSLMLSILICAAGFFIDGGFAE